MGPSLCPFILLSRFPAFCSFLSSVSKRLSCNKIKDRNNALKHQPGPGRIWAQRPSDPQGPLDCANVTSWSGLRLSLQTRGTDGRCPTSDRCGLEPPQPVPAGPSPGSARSPGSKLPPRSQLPPQGLGLPEATTSFQGASLYPSADATAASWGLPLCPKLKCCWL